MALTPKQEKFCQCVVSGMSYKDSYMTAYNCKSDRAALNEGSKLALREDIQKCISTLLIPLQKTAQQQAISEREKKKAIIWEELQNARLQQDHAAVARYMDILNKMDSEYINIQRIEKEETPVNDLDTNTLLKLVE